MYIILGCGTQRFTAGNYMKEMGLPHFDILLVVCSERFTSNDDNLIHAVKKQTQAPIFVIRSKFDIDIYNEIRDQGINIDSMSPEEKEEFRDGTENKILTDFLNSVCIFIHLDPT